MLGCDGAVVTNVQSVVKWERTRKFKKNSIAASNVSNAISSILKVKGTAKVGQTTRRGVNTIFWLANTSLLQVYLNKNLGYKIFIIIGNDMRQPRDV